MVIAKDKKYFLDQIKFLKARKDKYPFRTYLVPFREHGYSPVHFQKVFKTVHVMVVPLDTPIEAQCWGFESTAEREEFINHIPDGWIYPLKQYSIDGTSVEVLLNDTNR